MTSIDIIISSYILSFFLDKKEKTNQLFFVKQVCFLFICRLFLLLGNKNGEPLLKRRRTGFGNNLALLVGENLPISVSAYSLSSLKTVKY